MLVSGKPAKNADETQRNWLPFGLSLVLVLCLAAYAWIIGELAEPVVAAALGVCALVLIAVPLVLTLQLGRARVQRDVLSAKNTQLRTRENTSGGPSHYDGLTGVANRQLLADRFRFAAARAKRSGNSFALLAINLNDFSTIDDEYGQDAGDAVLVVIAKRLVAALRASDTVVRLSADRFVLIVESVKSAPELAHIRDKLFEVLSDMITLDSSVQVSAGAHIGVALFPNDGEKLEDLLAVADQSMCGHEPAQTA